MAREREQVLALALRAAQAREAAEQPAAVEIGLDRAGDDRAQRAGGALEALLVGPDVVVEVALEEPVEGAALRMARAIDRLGLGDGQRERRNGRPAQGRGAQGCKTGVGHGRISAGRDTRSHS